MHEEKEPKDEQGYYVTSVYIKNNSANPLDISYKEISSNYAQQWALPLHNSCLHNVLYAEIIDILI